MSHAETRDPLDIRLSDLPMTARTANCLMNNEGMSTLRDVVGHTAAELMRIPNFGRVSLREVESLLERYGLALVRSYQPPVLRGMPTDDVHERLQRIENILRLILDRLP